MNKQMSNKLVNEVVWIPGGDSRKRKEGWEEKN